MSNNTTPAKPDETKGPVANNVKGIDAHKTAATHHEEAAKHHKDAAKYHEAGDTTKANESAAKANDYSIKAAEHHKEITKATNSGK